jgi:hypothetical protein
LGRYWPRKLLKGASASGRNKDESKRCYYADETERKLASAKLGHEYLAATIRNGGSDDVIEAALTLIRNDVFLIEFKSSVEKNRPIFKRYFRDVEEHKTWPEADTGYGDYYFVLKKPSGTF